MIGKNRIRQDVDAEVLGQMLNATLDPYLAIVVVATGELILPHQEATPHRAIHHMNDRLLI